MMRDGNTSPTSTRISTTTPEAATPRPISSAGGSASCSGLTSDENVKKRIDDGYPLIWTIPEEGTGYDGTFALIFKGTEKLDAAKKVIDVLGTPEFSGLMAGIGYVTPRPAPNALYGKNLPKHTSRSIWTRRLRNGPTNNLEAEVQD